MQRASSCGRHRLALALTAVVCLAPAAQAMEHISLANGFDIDCHHHRLVDGKVRIYPQALGSDYYELAPEAIRAVETVPDPPALSSASPSLQAKSTESQLTPADLRQMLSAAGQAHNVDVDLLASVVKAESGGNAHAVSRTGARGLMQLMPRTARQLGVADSFAPEQNVRGGTAYLDALLTRYRNNLVLALAAYNAGPEAVDRYHGIPPYHETRAYVARVIHEFNRRVAVRSRLAPQSLASARAASY